MHFSPDSIPFVTQIAAPQGWRALLWIDPPDAAIASFGQRQSELNRIRQRVLERVATHMILLQTWKLSPEEATTIVDHHLHAWWPKLGMGVWPDREPPCGFTEDALNNVAAASFRHDEVPLPNHPLMLLQIPQAADRRAAVDLMSKGNALLEVFTVRDAKEVLARASEQFLPRILEPRFRRKKFYAPLLEARTVKGCNASGELEEWLCGADLYIRRSAEDRGILVIGRSELLAEVFSR